jgi:REP element-mobilizing transposase RayT
MSSTLVKIMLHIVFSTRQRAPFIDAALKADLYPYMATVAHQRGATVMALGGMPDHVHILLRVKASHKLCDLIQAIKAIPSKWVHHERPESIPEFGWQTGYAAFSVSQSNEAKVRNYILNQEAHHRRSTFENEFIGLLEKHQVEYDPDHLFD